MTHKDILTKFVIEYDKANVTSSYPSLTKYEITTILDKSYLNLIAQKVTGNNIRKSAFEQDIKQIADLQPLVTTARINLGDDKKQYNRFLQSTSSEIQGEGFRDRSMPDNMRSMAIPEDMLYFIQASTIVDIHSNVWWMNNKESDYTDNSPVQPLDNKDEDYREKKIKRHKLVPIQIVDHKTAERFFATAYNIPWVKIPVGFFEDNRFFILCDPVVGMADVAHENTNGERVSFTYIKQPQKFVDGNDDTEFELSDSVAEELISLAVSYGLENVESPRLNTHLGMRGLES